MRKISYVIERLRYGVFGDAVNTTQRLEAACAPGQILISEHLEEILRGADLDFRIVPAGTISPKGKLPLNTYTLEFDKEDTTESG